VADRRRDQCLFCTSRRCHTRIVADSRTLGFDEVACNRHVRELEQHADATLPKGAIRWHLTGNRPYWRGQPLPARDVVEVARG
jgi:hypothetical protein